MQRLVALNATETAAVKKNAPAEIARGIERNGMRCVVGGWGAEREWIFRENACAGEVVDLKAGTGAANDHGNRSRLATQSGDADRHRLIFGNNDGVLKAQVTQHRKRVGLLQRHRGLRHGFHAHHRGKKLLALKGMFGDVRISVRAQLGVGDQLNARMEDMSVLQKTQKRELRLLKPKRRQVAKAARNDRRGGRIFPGQHRLQMSDGIVNRERRYTLADEGVENAEALSHADPGPDRPLKI